MAAPMWYVAADSAILEIRSIPCQEEQAKNKNMTGKNPLDHKQKTKDILYPLSPSVVKSGMLRRRMGCLVRLSGKSLSFPRTRRMTSSNIPISSSPSCLHISFLQSALSIFSCTTPRTPRNARHTAQVFPDCPWRP